MYKYTAFFVKCSMFVHNACEKNDVPGWGMALPYPNRVHSCVW